MLERSSMKVVAFICLASFNLPMPRPKPGKVSAHFSDYHRFLTEKKTVEHHQIRMSKTSGKHNLSGKTSVIYPRLQGDKAFEAEISIRDMGHYYFKLFAYWFDDGPCLRFDSKGRAHCNPERGQGLKKRQIRAPHFHRFVEEENVEIAYQTPILGRDGNLIVNDYTLGLKHFCQEASLECNSSSGDSPVLIIEQGELALSSEDPQNGVSF